MSFLMRLTLTIPPIAGVQVSDDWIARSYRRDANEVVNWRGVIAWGCGVAVMLAFDHPLKNVLGIVAAAAAYYLATRIAPRRAAATPGRVR